MNKLLVWLITVFPGAALAHPNHGDSVYPLAHYLSGTHFLFIVPVLIFVALTYTLVRRYLAL